MPLFSRRRSATEPAIPVDDKVWAPRRWAVDTLSGPAASMDDDGQVTDCAWQVRFRHVVPPEYQGIPAWDVDSVITICTYVSYGPEEGTYSVGLRYQYFHPHYPDWSYTGWTAHPAGEVFGWEGTAAIVAETWARDLAAGDVVAKAALQEEVFDWDGRPF